uniref:Cellulase domain-containing protein n=1 Tax=Meloidogyne hapla TaxID=6305 RepID=A0A1I8BAX0_MELHA
MLFYAIVVTKFIILYYFTAIIVLAADPPYGQLSVNNGKLTGSNGNTLRGVSLWFSQWSTEFYSSSVVRSTKCTFNSNVIRAAIGPEANGYFDNLDNAINAATTVGDAAIHYGIYFIIDFHHGGPSCDNQDEMDKFTNKAIQFFTKILDKYKGSPNLLLELWNEPHCTWDKISEYHSKVLDAIRRIDPNVVCILGTPNASSGPTSEVVNNPLRVSNIIYTMHWYPVSDPGHINAQYKIIDNAIRNNVGIFVSEYGDADVTPGAQLDKAKTKRLFV